MATESESEILAEKYRKDMLLKMYDQMFAEINRHYTVVWQSVGVLAGAFAVFNLVDKGVISPDYVCSIFTVLWAWFLSEVLDANYWFNRDLAIIANIEKQFLFKEDLRQIHYYFGQHRRVNAFLTHFKIQFMFGLGIGFVVILYHFINRVLPGFDQPIRNFDLVRALPYLFIVGSTVFLVRLNSYRTHSYASFLRNSPGKDIDTNDINFGPGHPVSPLSPSPTEEPTQRDLSDSYLG